MEPRRRAQSILEYVTAKNCIIRQQAPKSVTNSRHPDWFCPQELKRWDEFDFPTLEHIYEGKLMNEIRSEGRELPEYPIIHSFQSKVKGETSTASIISRWNCEIVTTALKMVEDTLHPSLWTLSVGKSNWSIEFEEWTRLDPDAGAVAACESENDASAPPVERLPKDYKVGIKWNSNKHLHRLIDDTGLFIPAKSKSNLAMPLRQAYTYCVVKGCRYGCIVSTYEAFLFRIRPRTPATGLVGEEDLKRSIINDGLMEYVSVPWAREAGTIDGDAQHLTINLALFVLHTLAGNAHQLDWEYPPLVEEQLTTQPCDHVNQHSTVSETFSISSSPPSPPPDMRARKKRTREEEDLPLHSFVEDELPPFQERDDASTISKNSGHSQLSMNTDTARRYRKRIRQAA